MNVEEEVVNFTQGQGVNVVIDASGSPQALATSFKIAARFARVVIVGSPRGITEGINFYTDVMWKNLFIIGAHVHGVAPEIAYYMTPWQFGLSTRDKQKDLIFRLLANGDLKFNAMAAASIKMSHREVQEAYRIAYEEHDRALNVIMDWTD